MADAERAVEDQIHLDPETVALRSRVLAMRQRVIDKAYRGPAAQRESARRESSEPRVLRDDRGGSATDDAAKAQTGPTTAELRSRVQAIRQRIIERAYGKPFVIRPEPAHRESARDSETPRQAPTGSYDPATALLHCQVQAMRDRIIARAGRQPTAGRDPARPESPEREARRQNPPPGTTSPESVTPVWNTPVVLRCSVCGASFPTGPALRSHVVERHEPPGALRKMRTALAAADADALVAAKLRVMRG